MTEPQLLNFLFHCKYVDTTVRPVSALTHVPSFLCHQYAVTKHFILKHIDSLAVLYPYFLEHHISLSQLLAADRFQLDEMANHMRMTPQQRQCLMTHLPQYSCIPQKSARFEILVKGGSVRADSGRQQIGSLEEQNEMICSICNPREFQRCSQTSQGSLSGQDKKTGAPELNASSLLPYHRNLRPTESSKREWITQKRHEAQRVVQLQALCNEALIQVAQPFAASHAEGIQLNYQTYFQHLSTFLQQDNVESVSSSSQQLSTNAVFALLSKLGASRWTGEVWKILTGKDPCPTKKKRNKENVIFVSLCSFVEKLVATNAHSFLLAIFRRFTRSCPSLIILHEIEDNTASATVRQHEIIKSCFHALNLVVLSFSDVCTAFRSNPSYQLEFVDIAIEVLVQEHKSILEAKSPKAKGQKSPRRKDKPRKFV